MSRHPLKSCHREHSQSRSPCCSVLNGNIPWKLTKLTKYFLVEDYAQWLETWDIWYLNLMRIIKTNMTFAVHNSVLRMVNTWGEKIIVLRRGNARC